MGGQLSNGKPAVIRRNAMVTQRPKPFFAEPGQDPLGQNLVLKTPPAQRHIFLADAFRNVDDHLRQRPVKTAPRCGGSGPMANVGDNPTQKRLPSIQAGPLPRDPMEWIGYNRTGIRLYLGRERLERHRRLPFIARLTANSSRAATASKSLPTLEVMGD